MNGQASPRGSEWRKWDLHLHAPGTKLSDQFKASVESDVWDAYCQRLHASDVQAFGIADYFSADGYFSVREQFNKRYPDSTKVFFPNIELRTSYVVNKPQEEVHLHLLFNPSIQNHEAKIKSFLTALKTNITDDASRNVKASELNKSDYEAATTTREFIQAALAETFGPSADLLDFVIIITAANNDGIRPVRVNQRKLQLTDELDKFSDAFFGNAGNVSYFLETNRAEDKNVFTKPKPVLTGCDAHSLSDLDKRLGQVASVANGGTDHKPTWIKADLTYEGLKQIIFEPSNRVFIGAEPEIELHVHANKTRYIDSLHITCVDGYQPDQYGAWFCNETILLGKELVAIIGNKGNGKSAVTDIIGLLGNSHNQSSKNTSGQKPEELFSFLNKHKFCKGQWAKNFLGTLNWYEGQPDCNSLDADVALHLPEKVEYLPQKYLERICSNIADDEFRATLNKVIFAYVEQQDQHGKTSLDELIQYRSQQAQEDIARKKQELRQANATVISVEKKLTEDYRRELEEKIKLKKEDIEAHGKVKPEEKKNPEALVETPSAETSQVEQLTQRIEALTEQINTLKTERVEVSAAGEGLRQVRQSIKRAVEELTGLEDQHKKALESSGLTFGEIITITADYTTLDSVIEQKTQRVEQINALLASAEDITAQGGDDVASVQAQADARGASLVCQKVSLEEQKAELVERLGKPAREYQQYLTDLKRWTDREKELRGDVENPGPETLNGLEKEFESVKTVYQEHLRTARAERERISKEVFSDKRGLTQFYNAIKQSIDAKIIKCKAQLREYNITIDAGLRLEPSFFDEFLKFINQGVAGSFHGQEDARSMLHQFADTVTNWEDEGQVFAALNTIVEALHTDKRPERASPPPARDVFKQMKGQKSPQDLYDYLFGFDYLKPKYDLKVDGKDLSELSPGERGGLLLVFYLMLDRQEIPLVIDQPEDNLDNKSVYEILVTFIKQAKKRRQIILVTHNPNLAVVADAEQIIHVSIDKKDGKHDFDFISGAIENPQINKAVVDILEGTMPAFDNRRLKYRHQGRP